MSLRKRRWPWLGLATLAGHANTRQRKLQVPIPRSLLAESWKLYAYPASMNENGIIFENGKVMLDIHQRPVLQEHAALTRHMEHDLSTFRETKREKSLVLGQPIRVTDSTAVPGTCREETPSCSDLIRTRGLLHPADATMVTPDHDIPPRLTAFDWDTTSPHKWAADVMSYFFADDARPYAMPQPLVCATSAIGALLMRLHWRTRCTANDVRSCAAVNKTLVQLCWAAMVWVSHNHHVDLAQFLGTIHTLIAEPCPAELQARFIFCVGQGLQRDSRALPPTFFLLPCQCNGTVVVSTDSAQ
jgi:hypothetical protein